MSQGNVVRNAGSHRILYALSFGVKESKELKLVVGAINSIARFEGEYLHRLVGSGYVRKVFRGWALTERGKTKLDELGPVAGLKPKSKSFKKTPMLHSVYDPTTERRSPVRDGSEDFLNCPSRMGNRLYYRDGRVEEVEHGH